VSFPILGPTPDAVRGGTFRNAGAPFLVRLDLVDGRLELTGRLDHRTVHLVSDAITALLRTGAERWVVDVAGLTGCDHTGLRAIGATYRRALRHDRQLTLIGASHALAVALGRLRLNNHLLTPGDDQPAAPARISA